jgi:hypothetical protein
MYAWAQLAMDEKAADESLSKQKRDLAKSLEEHATKGARLASAAVPFDSFNLPRFDGWHITGNAFAVPAAAGQIVPGEEPARPVARFTVGGADSGLLTQRLQGELRSESFTINKNYVHVRVAGNRGRVNLVIDGYTLIMNPMYGKLTAAPSGNVLVWRTMPVDRWVGHRAYIEVSDCTIPMHGLNPPPSTARVPGRIGDGHIVLQRIVFSDDAEPPVAPNEVNRTVIARAAGDEVDQVAVAYEQLMIEAIDRWAAGTLGEDQVGLLNWLLESGLLDGEESGSRASADEKRFVEFSRQYRELCASLPSPQRAPALADGSGEDEFVFLRGNYRALGERAVRSLPEVLCDGNSLENATEGRNATEGVPYTSGSGRLELAERLVDSANPLAPRVIVNRLWQHHFGEGIVRSPDDFGRMGQAPTHPELLDYLAAELVRSDWSLKLMHRRMVEASVYRQGSNAELGMRNAESADNGRTSTNPQSAIRDPQLIDPENRLLHRMNIRRLEAEAVRDSVLAVSGKLNRAMHGPSVLPFVTPYMEGRGRPNSGPLDSEGRRSVYINARRNFLTPLLLSFDYPVTFTSIGRRGTSTIPAQALTLMNDPFIVEQAGQWAQRALQVGGSSTEQRIQWLYETAFARPPSADEVREAIDFLQEQSLRHGVGSESPQVWTDLCHVLINVKEFIFIP